MSEPRVEASLSYMAQPCCKSNKTRQQTTATKIHELAIVFDCYLSITVMKIEAERSESQDHPQLNREFISSSSGSLHLPLWTPAAWGSFLAIQLCWKRECQEHPEKGAAHRV